MFARIAAATLTPENFATARRRHKPRSRQREVRQVSESDLKRTAEHYLGTDIENSEWGEAKQQAERKLKGIIERFGDGDGARRQPYYLAQLIAEAVKSSRFSQFTLQLMELAKFADEQLGIKKGQPVS